MKKKKLKVDMSWYPTKKEIKESDRLSKWFHELQSGGILK